MANSERFNTARIPRLRRNHTNRAWCLPGQDHTDLLDRYKGHCCPVANCATGHETDRQIIAVARSIRVNKRKRIITM